MLTEWCIENFEMNTIGWLETIILKLKHLTAANNLMANQRYPFKRTCVVLREKLK